MIGNIFVGFYMPERYLRVPEDRIGALIGPEGKTKRKIEKITKTKITIDSKTGEVTIENSDAFNVLIAERICKAIARGFAPEKALLLAEDHYELRVISLREILGGSRKAIHTKKARIIGTKGSVRRKIESETNCFIVVYGDTIALIGLEDDLEDAESIILDIVNGAEIPKAFERLEERRLSKRKFEL